MAVRKKKQTKWNIKKILVLVIPLIIGISTLAMTQVSSQSHDVLCLSEFYQETAPELINPKLKEKSYPLCFEGFSLNYSGISRTPLWVAEKLTPERLNRKIKREDNFHEEERLPTDVRALLSDYKGSGYDRGHMAPNGDMGDKTSQYDSFSLANIIPQSPDNNQNTWREIEEATRAMVSKYQLDAYIVTGGAFLNRTVKPVKSGRVLIPSHVYKAVYFPQIGMASAYLSVNDTSRQAEIISICALEEKIGMNVFPQLDEQIKRQVYALPMQANKVKANKQPPTLQLDLISQCAPEISTADIKKTQQQFVVGKSYASGLNVPLSDVSLQDSSATPKSYFNTIALAVVQWLKQQEQK